MERTVKYDYLIQVMDAIRSANCRVRRRESAADCPIARDDGPSCSRTSPLGEAP